eukprot:g39815.t1
MAIGLEAPEVEYEVVFLQFACGVIVILKEAQDGHVIKGVGRGVKIVGSRKVLLITEYGVQMLHKLVTDSAFGLTDVVETTSGATDPVEQDEECTGESLLDLERLPGTLDRGVGA